MSLLHNLPYKEYKEALNLSVQECTRIARLANLQYVQRREETETRMKDYSSYDFFGTLQNYSNPMHFLTEFHSTTTNQVSSW